MKRFHFRLQPLILIRSLAEQQAREHYLNATVQLRRASERVASAEQDGELLYRHHLRAMERSVSGDEFARLRGELERAQHRLVEAQQAESEAEQHREKARLSWVEAQRALKIIERLRENALQEHRREDARLEQESLDELAVLRAAATSRPFA